MVTRLFWILFALEALALAGFLFVAMRPASRSPEGPVGAWILLLPPVAMAVAAAVFATTRSGTVKWICLAVLAYPLVLLLAGPVVKAYKNYRLERYLAGDETFHAGPLREIAHAVKAGDLEKIQTLLAVAGDLNRTDAGETILRFAVSNTRNTEIVKLLLDAGADPNRASYESEMPLAMAFYAGPAMVDLLLRAGANGNATDGAGRPLWWTVLSDESETLSAMLEVLGRHGVDVTMRDGESGPVGWAAYHRNWRAVWWLMEHGASWNEESRWGRSLRQMLEADLPSRPEHPAEAVRVAARLREADK